MASKSVESISKITRSCDSFASRSAADSGEFMTDTDWKPAFLRSPAKGVALSVVLFATIRIRALPSVDDLCALLFGNTTGLAALRFVFSDWGGWALGRFIFGFVATAGRFFTTNRLSKGRQEITDLTSKLGHDSPLCGDLNGDISQKSGFLVGHPHYPIRLT